MIRKHLFFSGRVQGVGFRMTTQSIAESFPVTGFVRNLSDGRVELVVEGAAGEVEEFLESLQRRMGAFIRAVEATEAASQGEFDGFEIR